MRLIPFPAAAKQNICVAEVGSMTLSMTTAAGRRVSAGAVATPDAAQELAEPWRPARIRLERRRLLACALAHARDHLGDRLLGGVSRPPAELVPRARRVHDRHAERKVDPTGGRRLEVEAPGQVGGCAEQPGGHTDRTGAEDAAEA